MALKFSQKNFFRCLSTNIVNIFSYVGLGLHVALCGPIV